MLMTSFPLMALSIAAKGARSTSIAGRPDFTQGPLKTRPPPSTGSRPGQCLGAALAQSHRLCRLTLSRYQIPLGVPTNGTLRPLKTTRKGIKLPTKLLEIPSELLFTNAAAGRNLTAVSKAVSSPARSTKEWGGSLSELVPGLEHQQSLQWLTQGLALTRSALNKMSRSRATLDLPDAAAVPMIRSDPNASGSPRWRRVAV